jgi:hypothetical protein
LAARQALDEAVEVVVAVLQGQAVQAAQHQRALGIGQADA